jgi:S1-C subfamily serine protease
MRIRTTSTLGATLGVIVLGLVASACTIQAGGQGSTATGSAYGNTLPPTNEPVAVVAAEALPAVVNVTTDMVSASGQTDQGVGTGFVVRADGIVVTNCHVVEGATKITVFTSAKNPDRYDARVIGGDCEHDLAVLKIDGRNLPTLPLGNSSDLVLGQSVVAIGYALALEGGPTVTTGIVSSLDRTVQVQDPNCEASLSDPAPVAPPATPVTPLACGA